MFKEKISLILPAHNEDENIKSLIQNIYQTFKENNLENLLEVIVVNDGSKDNTENEVNKMVKQYNNLILINLKSNVGKAYALDIGINNSNGKIIAIMDADLQYSAKNLINMINLINEGYDLVKDQGFVQHFGQPGGACEGHNNPGSGNSRHCLHLPRD